MSVETHLVPAFMGLPVLGGEGKWETKRQVIAMHPEGSDGSRRSARKLGLWGGIQQQGSAAARPGEREGVVAKTGVERRTNSEPYSRTASPTPADPTPADSAHTLPVRHPPAFWRRWCWLKQPAVARGGHQLSCGETFPCVLMLWTLFLLFLQK